MLYQLCLLMMLIDLEFHAVERKMSLKNCLNTEAGQGLRHVSLSISNQLLQGVSYVVC